MDVVETLSEGLKRELKITVPATDLAAKLDTRLNELKAKVRINGFRPGKVPVSHLRRLVGRSEMATIVSDTIGETVRKAVEDRGHRPALNPDIDIDEDKVQEVIDGKVDLDFVAKYELLPDIEIKDISNVALERPAVAVTDEDVDDSVKRIAEGSRAYEEKGADATVADGDRVTIDYAGRIDGELFEGGSAEGIDLVVGSGQFIPGFEEQLVGARVGEDRTVTVTFPEDYGVEHLDGKQAVFDVKVTATAAPGELTIDDDMAVKLGLESLDKLKQVVREQIEGQYNGLSRQKLKRQLLDKLDEVYVFEVPAKLVEGEFEQIWKQVNEDLERAGKTFADEDTTEEAARADYMKIAERRVRLGLVLSEIGEKNDIQVTDEEVNRALVERVRQFPGQEREVFDFYRNNAMALASLRAPLFEEKVVDFLIGQVQVSDKPVTREELLASEDEDEDEGTATAATATT